MESVNRIYMPGNVRVWQLKKDWVVVKDMIRDSDYEGALRKMDEIADSIELGEKSLGYGWVEVLRKELGEVRADVEGFIDLEVASKELMDLVKCN